MILTARLSKFVLVSHITSSVGWLGAVAVFLALAITGLNSQDIQLSRASCLAMELSAWFVIVPFCLTSLFTGIVQAIGTKWGLLKYYWVVVKLFLTIASTALLLLHMQPISYLAGVAAGPSFSNSRQSEQLIQLIEKAGATILVLLAVTTISVYKPWGRIQFGMPGKYMQNVKTQDPSSATGKSVGFYSLIGLLVLLALFIIIHLFGGGMGHH